VKRGELKKPHHQLRLYSESKDAVSNPNAKSKIPTAIEIDTTKNNSQFEIRLQDSDTIL